MSHTCDGDDLTESARERARANETKSENQREGKRGRKRQCYRETETVPVERVVRRYTGTDPALPRSKIFERLTF